MTSDIRFGRDTRAACCFMVSEPRRFERGADEQRRQRWPASSLGKAIISVDDSKMYRRRAASEVAMAIGRSAQSVWHRSSAPILERQRRSQYE